MIAPADQPAVSTPGIVSFLAILLLVGSWGCTRQPERLWQKFGQPYTEAEFRRDKAECTREKKLDFDCMRSRGWVDVSPDRPAPAPEPEKAPSPRPY